jgi:hypothetical protein
LAILNDQSRVSFAVHRSVNLLRADYPVDDIWRAVVAGDRVVNASCETWAALVDQLVGERRQLIRR